MGLHCIWFRTSANVMIFTPFDSSLVYVPNQAAGREDAVLHLLWFQKPQASFDFYVHSTAFLCLLVAIDSVGVIGICFTTGRSLSMYLHMI